MKLLFSSLLLGLAAISGQASAAAPAAQHFFEAPRYKDVKLSPSGRYFALRVGDGKSRDRMAVLDTETLQVVGGVRMEQYDIATIRWVNDERLVYNVADQQEAAGNRRIAPGLYSVTREGKENRQLVHHTGIQPATGSSIRTRIEPYNTYLMPGAGAQDSDIIYLHRPVRDRLSAYVIERVDLVRLNTRTGQSSIVERPADGRGWMLDFKGEPAIMMSGKDGEQTIHHRNPESGTWRTLATFPAYGEKAGGFEPVGFMDANRLLVRTRINSDKSALHVLDLASGKLDPKPLLSVTEFDFNGDVVYSNKRMVGLHYLGDAHASVWFDDGMKTAQANVDKLLPGAINLLTPPALPETPWILVSSHSDRQPRAYSLYNSKTHELKTIGAGRPGINAAEMGRQDFVHFKARDGMSIPAWLTLPAKGGSKLPLVVMVHGGPYVRGDEWGWDADTQFLASRGYAVIKPEFRGSTGYGFKHFSAGWKQWGLKMQDDIADSVQWAVAQGHADPARVCIVGGSYGGYATLMGLAMDGDVYRCGVAFAAVSDIPLLFDSGNWLLSDMHDDYKKFGAPLLVGDVEKDAAQLEATSPLKQAARIKRPLLLAHGTDDRRVPLVHFTKMRKALEANKADAEFLEYDGEGHGWSTTANRVDFWTRVEKFLNKHIGNSTP